MVLCLWPPWLAVQNFLCKLIVEDCRPELIVFCRSVGGACCVALWAMAKGGVEWSVPGRYYLAAGLGALVAAVLGQTLLFRSYLHWELARSMVVYSGQPLVVIVLAWTCLGMIPDGQGLLGGAFILTGAVWFNLLGTHREKTDPAPPA